MPNKNFVSKVIVSTLPAFFIAAVVFAWTEPSSAPPTGNVPAPLNVSGTSQTKSGELTFPKMVDYDDNGYYVDPQGNSWLYRIYSYDIRSDIYYDRNNTAFYMDPAGNTVLNALTVSGDLNAVSISADGTQRLRFSEPGGLSTNGWLQNPAHFDLTNVSDNTKRGITMDVRTTQTSGTINTGGIAINIYTPPDNGGDVSAIWLQQTGGGNAISVYNLSANRPSGYNEYSNDGYAIEAAVDGSKHSIVSQSYNGIAYLGYVAGSNGAGLSIFPTTDTDSGRRALRVANAGNTQEKFFVQMDGFTYVGNNLRATGQVRADSGLCIGEDCRLSWPSQEKQLLYSTLTAYNDGANTIGCEPNKLIGESDDLNF